MRIRDCYAILQKRHKFKMDQIIKGIKHLSYEYLENIFMNFILRNFESQLKSIHIPLRNT